MRWISPAIIAILLTSNVQAGMIGFPSDLMDWFDCDPPAFCTERWWAANNDFEHEWIVDLRKGRPSARLARKRPEASLPFAFQPEAEGIFGDPSFARVDDGWIVGFNHGEFGASLWWFSPDGKERRAISKNKHWVVQFFRTDIGLLATVGIAHGTTSEGRIIRIVRDPDGPWRVEHILDLGGAPEVGLLEANGVLMVATNHRLLRVRLADKKTEVLVDDAFWNSLDPNSLVVDLTGKIFVGMRHGVARVEKKGPIHEVRWLVPDIGFDRSPLRKGFR